MLWWCRSVTVTSISVLKDDFQTLIGMITVAVGSLNPVKCSAVEKGLKSALASTLIQVRGFDAASGVRDQPIGDTEIKLGAVNRAHNAYALYKDIHGFPPSYSVGIEGGILINNEGAENEEMDCMAWIVIFDGTKLGSARTASFSLPRQISELIKTGMELGSADDAVFGRVNSKQCDGTVGYLTKGVMDRTALYAPAVTLAMIPFQWPSLWPAK